MSGTLYVGTIGQAVWRSQDGGETFRPAHAGMFSELDVRALAVHPQNPKLLYAGTDCGLYRTEDGGDHWHHLPNTPFDPGHGWAGGTSLWSLLLLPSHPDTLFVGTCPAALYRSQDGGLTWHKLKLDLALECRAIRYPRVTCLVADPTDVRTIWAGVEIDGLWRSTDGGETWQPRNTGLSSEDIHGLAIVPGEPGRIVVTTNNDLNLSTDGGFSWEPQHIKGTFPHGYCRGILRKPDDPAVLFVGNGNGPPGTEGTIQISRDAGRTWHTARLPVPPNSTIWTFAADPSAPHRIAAASVLGYLYLSDDGGDTWRKSRHEFGEIRALAIA